MFYLRATGSVRIGDCLVQITQYTIWTRQSSRNSMICKQTYRRQVSNHLKKESVFQIASSTEGSSQSDPSNGHMGASSAGVRRSTDTRESFDADKRQTVFKSISYPDLSFFSRYSKYVIHRLNRLNILTKFQIFPEYFTFFKSILFTGFSTDIFQSVTIWIFRTPPKHPIFPIAFNHSITALRALLDFNIA